MSSIVLKLKIICETIITRGKKVCILYVSSTSDWFCDFLTYFYSIYSMASFLKFLTMEVNRKTCVGSRMLRYISSLLLLPVFCIPVFKLVRNFQENCHFYPTLIKIFRNSWQQFTKKNNLSHNVVIKVKQNVIKF